MEIPRIMGQVLIRKNRRTKIKPDPTTITIYEIALKLPTGVEFSARLNGGDAVDIKLIMGLFGNYKNIF